jgi:hypothetical protein
MRTASAAPLDHEQRPLVQRYVDAFTHHDIDSLVALLA